ncbi:MAG: LPS export ABC transporter periplasmic protein LptC, partial [Candidatus Firestonebacteria bacterium]
KRKKTGTCLSGMLLLNKSKKFLLTSEGETLYNNFQKSLQIIMNKPSKTRLLLIGVFVVPLVVIISVFSYSYFITTYPGKNFTEQKSDIKEVKYPGLNDILFKGIGSVENFDITEYKDGQKSFTLQGKKLEVKNRKFGTMRVAFGKVAEIDNAAIIFYEGNKPASTLVSPKATIDLLKKEITLYDNVNVISKDKRVLTCDNATWHINENFILTEGNCILDTVDGKRVTGDLVKTDINLKDYSVLKEKAKNPLKNIMTGFIGMRK